MASHLIFGQINIFLMALVLWDLFRKQDRGLFRHLPKGVFVGVAAAIKLTPALFILYFLISGQRKKALISLCAAAIATLVGVICYPTMSWSFFSSTVWHLSDTVSLNGFFATSGNNSISGALAALGEWTRIPAAVLVVACGIWALRAARISYRKGRHYSAALIVGLAACLISPVSWMHHWVYVLPALAIIWRLGGRERRCFSTIGALILLATGPTIGDLLISWKQPLLLPLAVVFRESLLIVSIGCIYLLNQPRSAARLSQLSSLEFQENKASPRTTRL